VNPAERLTARINAARRAIWLAKGVFFNPHTPQQLHNIIATEHGEKTWQRLLQREMSRPRDLLDEYLGQ